VTDESTHQSDSPTEGAPPPAGTPDAVGADPTPAQLLGISPEGSPTTPVTEQTPAQLLGMTPDLAASLNLDEPQNRGDSLATELRKGAGSSEPPKE
jgi:hypothetical protein